MTTPTVANVVQMRRPRVRPTLSGMLAEGIRAQLELVDAIAWPSPIYQDNPCGFSTDVLGCQLWAKQREILEAVRDHDRVTVRSGHKCGKSTVAAVIALWWFCSFPDARSVLTSTTSRQVDQILWREIRKLRSRSKKPIPGEMHELARSGFKASDFREIVGFTAREAEAVAGISGSRLIYILDEASGIDDAIFEAIEGNRAGGAKIVMFSNPTRTEGEFFRSHEEKAKKADGSGFYRTIHVSSEDTPNAKSGKNEIPGLATKEWVDEKRLEWGEHSALYKVRVKGEFVLAEDGKILSVHAIAGAEAAWADAPEVGRLFVGLDPSGPGDFGDESAFAARRGAKVLDVVGRRGLTEDGHVVELLGFLKKHRRAREIAPVVVIDREGPIGSAIYGRLRAHAAAHPEDFVVVGVRSSDKASRQPDLYDRVRDELWANLAEWIRDGGAIPEDARLARELHAPSWTANIASRLKATPKSELRKMLDGRSPDRADAVALSVWETAAIAVVAPRRATRERDEFDEDLVYGGAGIDPYALDGGIG